MYYNGDRLWRWFSRYTYKVKTPLLCLHIRVSTAGVFLWDIRRQIKGKYAFFCLKCKEMKREIWIVQNMKILYNNTGNHTDIRNQNVR